MTANLHDMLYKFMSEYKTELEAARIDNDFKRPFGQLVRKTIAKEIGDKLDKSVYKVKGSVGAGRWTDVPWIAVFDKRITTSAQREVYIVYLLNRETKELYLTFNQGATSVAQMGGSATGGVLSFTGIANASSGRMTERLKNKAKEIRSTLGDFSDLMTDEIHTGSAAYDAGCIYYKKYTLNSLPDDTKLISDLNDFINVYKSCYGKMYASNEAQVETEPELDEVVESMLEKKNLEAIEAYIYSKGFVYSNDLIRNMYLSLKSKPFVILAGISGTGKSKLAELFAEASGATLENGRYKLVPVRPDWSDSSDLFGHMNLSDRFVEGTIIDLVKRATDDPDNPYFLCLDEMNLARVEYYFSDYLSVLETRKWNEDKSDIVTDVLIGKELWVRDQEAIKKYGESDLHLPSNLYVIGTVNMDETTFSFSKKVLDRANTIEFSEIQLVPQSFDAEECEPYEYDNSFFRADYLQLPSDEDFRDFVLDVCNELEKINDILEESNSQVAYRVRDELVSYRVLNHKYGLMPENDAMDFEIMQKILPRLQGSSTRTKRTLCGLFKHCAGDFVGSNDMDAPELAENMRTTYSQLISANNCKYRRSAKKLIDMVERFEEDGFTSFWA